MIERYTDHAANERTFLAWVRTSIAIMAFGFLVEKFDLFLEFASKSLATRLPSIGGQLVGNIAGLLLIAVPTQNSESQRNHGVSLAFRVLSRDRWRSTR